MGAAEHRHEQSRGSALGAADQRWVTDRAGGSRAHPQVKLSHQSTGASRHSELSP